MGIQATGDEGFVEHGKVGEAIRIEKAIYEECRIAVERLDRRLHDLSLLPALDKEYPSAAIAQLHAAFMFRAPDGWNLGKEVPLPRRDVQPWLLRVAAQIRKRIARKEKKSGPR